MDVVGGDNPYWLLCLDHRSVLFVKLREKLDPGSGPYPWGKDDLMGLDLPPDHRMAIAFQGDTLFDPNQASYLPYLAIRRVQIGGGTPSSPW
jgi:hypothetical protein